MGQEVALKLVSGLHKSNKGKEMSTIIISFLRVNQNIWIVVIIVFSILNVSCKKDHHIYKGATEIRSLVGAILCFREDYHINPCVSNKPPEIADKTVLNILMATPGKDYVSSINTKGICYLYLSARMGDGTWLDPWGSPYNIRIAEINQKEILVGKNVVDWPVVAWSNGRNKINEFGYGDDIRSWE